MSLIVQILFVISLTSIYASNIANNSFCHIQNRLYNNNGYLHPESDKYNHDSSRRNIYADNWLPYKNPGEPFCWPYNDNCKWKFEVQKGHQNGYKLKNGYYGEYLYSAADDLQYDAQRRRSFTWIAPTCDDPECYWTVEQVPGTDYYTLKNERYQDHLYAAADDFNLDEEHRSVFGRKWNGDAGVNTDEASHWTITC